MLKHSICLQIFSWQWRIENFLLGFFKHFPTVAVLSFSSYFSLQRCLNLLDIGARESLSDVISKVLRKVANQPEGKEEDLDDTLIT